MCLLGQSFAGSDPGEYETLYWRLLGENADLSHFSETSVSEHSITTNTQARLDIRCSKDSCSAIYRTVKYTRSTFQKNAERTSQGTSDLQGEVLPRFNVAFDDDDDDSILVR